MANLQADVAGPMPSPDRQRRNTMTALIAGGVVLGMVGMAFAAVPLYQLFCQVTGFGGTTQRVEHLSDQILDRVVIVRFDANIANTLGWEFEPGQTRVNVQIGEATEITYLAINNSNHTTVGTAIFNVTPESVGAYFMKVECFCFTDQTLAPGESVVMPVLFYVDPALADDPNLDYVDTITLSYTFFPVIDAETEPVAQNAVGGDG